jgi:DNA/RNA-binding domain of Phe-tRNA-synthetase-like protein
LKPRGVIEIASEPDWDPTQKGEQYTEIEHEFALMPGVPIGVDLDGILCRIFDVGSKR